MQTVNSNKIKGPHKAEILENIELAQDIWKLVLKNKIVAQTAKPGQFVSVLCEDTLLRRPFSIANAEKDYFEIIYKIKGKGTKYLKSLKNGDFLDVIGTFGNGFCIENKFSLLVGCGVGIAPVNFLSKILINSGINHKFLMSTQTFVNINNENSSIIITEDGSVGKKGRLDYYFENIIKEMKPEKIYTCGPNPAMEYVCNIASKYNIPVDVSLERDFACGTGVCMGCVIQIKQDNMILNKRICKDGPVFNGDEVIW